MSRDSLLYASWLLELKCIMFMLRWVCGIERKERHDSLLNYENQSFYWKNEKVDEPLLLSMAQFGSEISQLNCV